MTCNLVKSGGPQPTPRYSQGCAIDKTYILQALDTIAHLHTYLSLLNAKEVSHG